MSLLLTIINFFLLAAGFFLILWAGRAYGSKGTDEGLQMYDTIRLRHYPDDVIITGITFTRRGNNGERFLIEGYNKEQYENDHRIIL